MYVPRAQCPAGLSGIRHGLGCVCDDPGCGCGGQCGLGRARRGLGLFDSMDFTTWGLGEWAVIGVGAYLVLSLAGDVRTGGAAVKKYRRRGHRTYRAIDRSRN